MTDEFHVLVESAIDSYDQDLVKLIGGVKRRRSAYYKCQCQFLFPTVFTHVVGIRRNEDVSVIKHMIFYSQKAMEMEKFFVVIARWYGAVKLDRIMAAFFFSAGILWYMDISFTEQGGRLSRWKVTRLSVNSGLPTALDRMSSEEKGWPRDDLLCHGRGFCPLWEPWLYFLYNRVIRSCVPFLSFLCVGRRIKSSQWLLPRALIWKKIFIYMYPYPYSVLWETTRQNKIFPSFHPTGSFGLS